MSIDPQSMSQVLQHSQPVVTYLFGSAAAERLRPDSDLAVAFFPARPCDPYEVFQAAQELATATGREVDLMTYPAPPRS